MENPTDNNAGNCPVEYRGDYTGAPLGSRGRRQTAFPLTALPLIAFVLGIGIVAAGWILFS